MGLSANTLFHFTEFEFLKSILKNGFYPRCSVEQLVFSDITFPVAIPMVSFCDIRFSQLTEHLNHYKPYGIGLTKTWGIKNGINPVFYIEKSTFPHSLIKNMLLDYFRLVPGTHALRIDTTTEKETFYKLLQMVGYCKVNNTQRWDKFKKEFTGEWINFYDEREWRYFLGIQQTNESNLITIPFIPGIKNDLFDFAETIERHNLFCESKPLKFTNQDIRYIIVNDDNEINQLIEYMRSEKLFQDSMDVLVSKMNSVQRIKEDH